MSAPNRRLKTFRLPEATLVTLSTDAQRLDTTQTDLVLRGIPLAVEEREKELAKNKPNN